MMRITNAQMKKKQKNQQNLNKSKWCLNKFAILEQVKDWLLSLVLSLEQIMF